jgi:hypothetical protein
MCPRRSFVKWLDSSQSEEPSFAPLIFVPVTMTRVRGSDGYAFDVRDEEIDWAPSAYCAFVATEVARYKRWEVKPLNTLDSASSLSPSS